MKNKDINLKSIKKLAATYVPVIVKHLSFIGIILILLVYLLTVFRIRELAGAEPSPDSQDTTQVTSVPKVDQQAINDVLQLENNSPQVHSLFNQARNNPFNE